MTQATYRIGEVAQITGFAPSTLRYYEDQGLLPAPERSRSGQRIYRRSHVDRLRFMGRAKRLGLTLEEIATLADAWEHQACSVTHDRLVAFLDARLVQIHDEIIELTGFAEQLEDVYERVAGQPAVNGRCGPACGCAPVVDTDPPQRWFGRPAVAAE